MFFKKKNNHKAFYFPNLLTEATLALIVVKRTMVIELKGIKMAATKGESNPRTAKVIPTIL